MTQKIKHPPLVALERMPQAALWHSVLDLFLNASSTEVLYEASVLITNLLMLQRDDVPRLTGAQVHEMWQKNSKFEQSSKEEENG